MSERIVTTYRASEKEELGYARDVARAFRAWLDSDDESDSPIRWMMDWLEGMAIDADARTSNNVTRLTCRDPSFDEINALCVQADAASPEARIKKIFSDNRFRRSITGIEEEVLEALKN